MGIKVIGAGVGRTGTYSLKLALEALGYGPCHHMEEVVMNGPRQVPLWAAAVEGRPDWEAAFEGYGSAVDWPTAGFWRELAEHYPDAKVVLTTRDPELWYESVSETIFTLMPTVDEAPPHMRPWFDMCNGVIAKTGFRDIASRSDVIEAFRAHERAVRAAVPADRLLVFQVREGWDPLCRFLGKPVPADPFPRSNNREEFWDLVQRGMGAGGQTGTQ